MTPFASVAIIKRNGGVVFKPPRKEQQTEQTQVRKAAVRFWRGNIAEDDKLLKIFLVREIGGKLTISETDGRSRWVVYDRDIKTASAEPHIAACLAELGIDANAAPALVPDVLEINGHTYRRDI